MSLTRRLLPTLRVPVVTIRFLAFYVLCGLAAAAAHIIVSPAPVTVRPEVSGGVAVWAHVGGFIAGLLLVPVFRSPLLVEKHRRMMASMHTGFFR